MSFWAVVLAHLAERSLPISEVPGSNPVIGNILSCTYFLSTVEKTEKRKKARDGQSYKTNSVLNGSSMQRVLNNFVMWNITVWLTSCLTGYDPAGLLY